MDAQDIRKSVELVEKAIEAIRRGEMVILTDDEDRENEGDLVMAAQKVTPQGINFMATHARGLICLTVTEARARKLQLPLMVQDNGSQFQTAFTVTIEAKRGVSTGISAADRAVTIQTAVHPKARASDLVRPGHVFPLVARDGGVLVRTGQTEGSVDLARLAGFEPAGVICEIMNADGTMARRDDLICFARHHQMVLLSVTDLIRYRLESERLVRQIEKVKMPIAGLGEFSAVRYHCIADQREHVAFVKGRVDDYSPVLVRMHVCCPMGDANLFSGCQCGPFLRKGLERIASEGRGVLVYLNHGACFQLGCVHSLKQKVGAGQESLREVGVGAQILRDLGISSIRLMTDHPPKTVGMQAYGLSVVEAIPMNASTETEKRMPAGQEQVSESNPVEPDSIVDVQQSRTEKNAKNY